MRKFAVGQTIWTQDPARILYENTLPFRAIPESGWLAAKVVAIVGRSYEIKRGRRPAFRRGFKVAESVFLTTEEKEDQIFALKHRKDIADRIFDVDAKTLRSVANLVGYEP